MSEPIEKLLDHAAMMLLIVAKGDDELVLETLRRDQSYYGVVNVARVTKKLERAVATVH
jgi:hypothetical protein